MKQLTKDLIEQHEEDGYLNDGATLSVIFELLSFDSLDEDEKLTELYEVKNYSIAQSEAQLLKGLSE